MHALKPSDSIPTVAGLRSSAVRSSALGLLLLLTSLGNAWAAQDEHELQDIVVFGASLSDVGNVKAALPGLVLPPYFEGRFTNGPVWHEVMAERLGLPAASTPSLQGGNNYAFGGAEVGPGFAELIGVPNVGTQIDIFLNNQAGLGQLPLSRNTLFVVSSGGGNNLIPPGLPQEPEAIVSYLENHIVTLADAGARHFLVPNFFYIENAPMLIPLLVDPAWLPPGVQSEEDAEEILARAEETNRRLRNTLRRLERRLDRRHGGVTITQFDMFLASRVINNAPQLFGIEEITTQALTPPFPACFCTGFIQPGVDPDRYLWFDVIHPTARVHEILGELAAASLHPALKTDFSTPPLR